MEKKNNFMLVMIVILSVSLLGTVSFIVYDKVIKKDEGTNTATKTTNNDQTNNIDLNVQYMYKVSNRHFVKIASADDGHMSVLVDTKGDVYFHIYADTDDRHNLGSYQDRMKKLQSEQKTYNPEGYKYIDYDTQKYVNEYKGIKLNISNVSDVFYVRLNNDGSSGFLFVQENGDVSYLDYYEILWHSNLELKKVNELKNIVSLQYDNTIDEGYAPYAITIEGKEISLYGILEKYLAKY